MKVIAIVGMSGSGKSEVAWAFEEKGFVRIRFGDLTDREVLRRRLALNEKNERHARERLREEHGMAAYAILNLPAIDAALQRSDVVVDGLYSWEEYKVLKEYYGEDFLVVTVYSSPAARQKRLSRRPIRPLTVAESMSRDFAEIENLGKGGPIAMADFILINESSLERLIEETKRLISTLVS